MQAEQQRSQAAGSVNGELQYSLNPTKSRFRNSVPAGAAKTADAAENLVGRHGGVVAREAIAACDHGIAGRVDQAVDAQ
jgi:hypothetical protein